MGFVTFLLVLKFHAPSCSGEFWRPSTSFTFSTDYLITGFSGFISILLYHLHAFTLDLSWLLMTSMALLVKRCVEYCPLYWKAGVLLAIKSSPFQSLATDLEGARVGVVISCTGEVPCGKETFEVYQWTFLLTFTNVQTLNAGVDFTNL